MVFKKVLRSSIHFIALFYFLTLFENPGAEYHRSRYSRAEPTSQSEARRHHRDRHVRINPRQEEI